MLSHVDKWSAARPVHGAFKIDIHAALLWFLIGWTLLGVAGQLHLVLTDSLVNSVDLLFDDAYYYLGVAWNLGHGHGSKFTEPLLTNGYHPLWLLLLTGLTAALDLSKTGLVCATLLLTAGVKCLAYAFFHAGGDDAARRTAGRIAIFVVVSKFAFVFSLGLETTLFLIVVPWVLSLATTRGWSRRHALGVGLALGIAFLTRLDALAFGAIVLIGAIATRRASVRAACLAVLPLGLTIAAYAAVNLHFFSTPLPLSGQAKAIGSHFGGNLRTMGDYFKSLSWSALMLGVWAVARLTVAPRLRVGGFELVTLGATLFACALYYGTFSGWPIWPWYLYPNAFFTFYATIAGGLGAAAIAAFGVGWVGRRTGAPAAVRSVSLVVVAVALTAQLLHLAGTDELVRGHLAAHFLNRDRRDPARSSFNQQNVALLPWLAARYPNGATLAMGDRAGGLGYWMPSNFSMVQLEGLVADRSYLTALAAGRVEEWLSARGVDLYITDRPRAFVSGETLGFVEPVQPRLNEGPLNVLCFRDGDELLRQDYRWGSKPQMRRVFGWHSVVACPMPLLSRIRTLQARYDGIRSFSGLE